MFPAQAFKANQVRASVPVLERNRRVKAERGFCDSGFFYGRVVRCLFDAVSFDVSG